MINHVSPTAHPTGPEYGHRLESIRVELLDTSDNFIRELKSVESVNLDGHWTSAVLWGGKMKLTDPGDIDWLQSRVKIYYAYSTPDDPTVREYPRGIFIPATPTGNRVEGSNFREVELYDKTQVFHEDVMPTSYSVEAGENVMWTVKNIVREVEGVDPDIIDYDDKVRVTMTWKPGTTKLTIIRDLLDSMNMSKFQMGNDGELFSYSPVILGEQPPSWVFRDSQYEGLYVDGWGDEQDLYAVPNRWVGWTRSDGETEPLYSSAENTDPDSPFSFQARGRWVTRITEDVDTTSQAKLDAVIEANLTRATHATHTLTVEHPWIPIALGDTVEFHNEERDLHALCEVRSIKETLQVPGVLQKTKMVVGEYL